MKSKISSIIGWICVILIAALNIFAGVMKFMPPTPEAVTYMQKIGVSLQLDHMLGVLELCITLLYLIPRTSTVGTVLMVGYLGGAFATNLTHGLQTSADVIPFLVFFLILAIGAWFRNPELTTRLRGTK